jgi:hypothetical protein
VDGTGSGSCPMAGFGISGVEPLVHSSRLSEPYEINYPTGRQM